jgi:hypothetical protein
MNKDTQIKYESVLKEINKLFAKKINEQYNLIKPEVDKFLKELEGKNNGGYSEAENYINHVFACHISS